MRALVVVRGVVDERDIWPYASLQDRDGVSTRLMVKAHDSRELVGVLLALLELRLEVVSMRVITDPPGRTARSREVLERPAIGVDLQHRSSGSVPLVTRHATQGMQREAVRSQAPHDPQLTRPPCEGPSPSVASTLLPDPEADTEP